jgi:hypothetical protein
LLLRLPGPPLLDRPRAATPPPPPEPALALALVAGRGERSTSVPESDQPLCSESSAREPPPRMAARLRKSFTTWGPLMPKPTLLELEAAEAGAAPGKEEGGGAPGRGRRLKKTHGASSA